jgi:hypothetical protein
LEQKRQQLLLQLMQPQVRAQEQGLGLEQVREQAQHQVEEMVKQATKPK